MAAAGVVWLRRHRHRRDSCQLVLLLWRSWRRASQAAVEGSRTLSLRASQRQVGRAMQAPLLLSRSAGRELWLSRCASRREGGVVKAPLQRSRSAGYLLLWPSRWMPWLREAGAMQPPLLLSRSAGEAIQAPLLLSHSAHPVFLRSAHLLCRREEAATKAAATSKAVTMEAVAKETLLMLRTMRLTSLSAQLTAGLALPMLARRSQRRVPTALTEASLAV